MAETPETPELGTSVAAGPGTYEESRMVEGKPDVAVVSATTGKAG
ncbi:MAG: hypothetical protein ABSD62_01850 [Candidatus Limnocylindrales bacterium]